MTSLDRRDDVSREEAAVPGEVRRWRAFSLIAVAFLMIVVDLTIINVALPTIGRKLHFPQQDLQWVVTAYALTFGGFLLLGGRAADLLGRRRLFMAGLAIFTAASLACALATTDTFLIIMRGLQGLGAAVVLPAALSIVMNMFSEGAERNKALGIWGGIGAAGATVGVLAGGLLTRYAGWQYIFYLNVPIGAAALLLARRVVPESRLASAHRRYDLLGAVTVTGALVMLVYAISQAPTVGWTAVRTLALLAASAALLAGFLVLETRAEAPLLPLRLFRLKTLAGSNAVGFLLGASFFAFIFIGTLYMQQVLGYSALKTGLAWLATSVTGLALAGPAQIARHPRVGQAGHGGRDDPDRRRDPVGYSGPGARALLGQPRRSALRRRRLHLGVHPGINRSAGRRRRARRRSRLRADEHLPADRRGNRRGRRVHRGGNPLPPAAGPRAHCSRRAHRRIPVGVLGMRAHRTGRRPRRIPAHPPHRTRPRGRGLATTAGPGAAPAD